MENSEFKEIMDALREISNEQCYLKAHLEDQVRTTVKIEKDTLTLNQTVEKHDMFMKVSLWAYGLIISTFSIKLFHWT